MATEQKDHPFLIKNLPYSLKVPGFGTEMTVFVETDDNKNIEDITNNLSAAIYSYNKKSELEDRKDGVVHNHHIAIIDNTIELRVDTGSTGILIIKKLLKILAKETGIKQVIMDL